ncbi:Polar-differentiation response regulator DivK [compost metagenome]
MNGYETLECLQRSAGTCGIPVLAISAFAQLSDLAMARDTGFAGYITKPIQVRVFTETVQELLAGAGRLTRN